MSVSGEEPLLAKAGSGGALSRGGCARALAPPAGRIDLVPNRPSARRSLLRIAEPGAFPFALDESDKRARSADAC